MDIIIPTVNNIQNKNSSIYYTLRSILSQSYQNNNIFVVENGNYSEMKDFIYSEFGNYVNVIDGTYKTNNISYSRNLGASKGNNEIILFMDDDTIIGNNNHLEYIKKKMEYEDFYCGASRYWTHPNWNECIQRGMNINQIRHILKSKSFLPEAVERLSGKQSFHQFTYIGNFGAIKRSVFDNVSGFDENFQGWTYQDTDLMMRLCFDNYSYELMEYDSLYVYHLSHRADKSKYRDINREKYRQKQKKLGKKFYVNHFFGYYNDESFALFREFD